MQREECGSVTKTFHLLSRKFPVHAMVCFKQIWYYNASLVLCQFGTIILRNYFRKNFTEESRFELKKLSFKKNGHCNSRPLCLIKALTKNATYF